MLAHLQLLVRKVNTQLLKAICLEALKAEDVENADASVGLRCRLLQQSRI